MAGLLLLFGESGRRLMTAIPPPDGSPSTATEIDRPKLGALQTIRGLGALIVVFAHLAAVFPPVMVPGNTPEARRAAELLLGQFPVSVLVSGRFAVSMFFVLSGFVLSARYLGPRPAGSTELCGAIAKRAARLWPMVIASVLFSTVLGRLGLTRHVEAAAFTGAEWLVTQTYWNQGWVRIGMQVIAHPFTAGVAFNPPLWTIGVALNGSMLVYFLLLFSRGSRWRGWIYAAALLVFRNDQMAAFVVVVVLADGWLTWKWCAQWASSPLVAVPVAAVALFLAGWSEGSAPGEPSPALYAWLPRIAFGAAGWHFVGATLLLAVVLGCPRVRPSLEGKVGRWFGSISYALYATHFPVIWSVGCAVFLGLRPHLPYPAAAGLASLAALAASLFVACLFERYVDRPSLSLAQAIGRRFEATFR